MKSINITTLNQILSNNFDGENIEINIEKKFCKSPELKEYFVNEYLKYSRIKNSITKIKTRISNLF